MKKFVLLLSVLAGGTAALAQEKAPPPPDRPTPAAQPPLNAAAAKPQRAAGQSYLERRFGLSREEAERRLALEDQVSDSAASLERQFEDSFLGSIIDHQPAFQVTFVFSRDVAADEVRRAIPTGLQAAFKVKRSRYSAAEIRAREAKVVDALVAAKIAGSVGYDYRTDKFEVTAEQEGGQRLMTALPAELRPDVRFVAGGRPTRVQSGMRTGDAIYGGWMVHQMTSGGATAICTYGFMVKTPEAQNGVLTSSADNCSGSLGIHYDDGHNVVLPTPPSITKNIYNTGGSRSYDYQVLNTGSLTTAPYTWFWNNKKGDYYQLTTSGWQLKNWANVNPNYPLDGGYTRVTGVIAGVSGTSNTNHPQGATRCKGGFTTGITCGQISLSQAAATMYMPDGSVRTFYGYVKVEGTDYMVFSYGGDSGGPVMTTPVWNGTAGYYDAKAAGIVEMGSIRDRGDGYDRPCITPDDGSCPMYYMPIDRVNDHLPYLIQTTSGGVSPN
jgi:hypothetical protein